MKRILLALSRNVVVESALLWSSSVALSAMVVLGAPAFASEPVLIPLRANDSAVVILDSETPTGDRPEVVIPPSQSPGRVILERRAPRDEARSPDWA